MDITALLATDRRVKYDDVSVPLIALEHNWSPNLERFNLRCVVGESTDKMLLAICGFCSEHETMDKLKA